MRASAAAFPFSIARTAHEMYHGLMKTLFPVIVAIGLLLPTACTTLQREVTAKIIARRATYEVLKGHPQYKPAFVASVTAIDSLLLDETINREAFTLALQNLKINELKGAEGTLIIADILDLIDIAIEDKPLLGEGLPRLRELTKSISEGIALGIALATPPAPVP